MFSLKPVELRFVTSAVPLLIVRLSIPATAVILVASRVLLAWFDTTSIIRESEYLPVFTLALSV